MPRTARVDYPGARHHIGNRGARREPIFFDDESRLLFLSLLADLPTRFAVRVNAYVLMTNHFHLVLHCPRGNAAQAMRHVDGEYARRVNRPRRWDGPLFKSRYHNQVVDDDHYLRCLIAYIHLNPVVAHMVRDPGDYDWSSHQFYAGRQAPPDWLDLGDAAAAFGTPAAYLEFLDDTRMRRDVLPPDFDPADLWKAPTREYPPELPDHVASASIDLRSAVEQVADVADVDISTLKTARRGRHGNRERWLLAWWLTRGVGVRPAEVARFLGVDRSGVSRMVETAVLRATSDPWMRRSMDRLSERMVLAGKESTIRNKRPPGFGS